MECVQCGATVTTEDATCQVCGTAVAAPVAGGHDGDVHRLLAEANLFRMRGQHEEAIGICTRVLRLMPDNAPAHSLLGDIYREQGNLREAMGWYKLAVQLNPEGQADRRKLDEMIDLVFQGVTRTQPAGNGVPHIAPPPPPPEHERKGTGSLTRPGAGNLQPVHVGIAGAVIVLGVALLVMFSAPTKTAMPSPKRSPVSTAVPTDDHAAGSATVSTTVPGGTQVTPPPPDPIEQGPDGIMIKVQPEGKSTQTAPTTPTRPAPATTQNAAPPAFSEVPPFQPPTSKDPMSLEEVEKQTAALRETINRTLPTLKLGATVERIAIDPTTNEVTFEYTIPAMRDPAATKQGLLYIGFYLVWAAMAEPDAHWKAYALRGFAPTPAGKAATLSLVAKVTPQQADAARAAKDYRTVVTYLTDPKWRADLVSAGL